MVEHITRSPEAVPILEAEVASPTVPRRGLCLICGSWLEVGGDQDACAVTLARDSTAVSEHVAHVACLERVVHPSATLPGSPPTVIPENQLASKFLTPSGR
jgi:hypothetical protein